MLEVQVEPFLPCKFTVMGIYGRSSFTLFTVDGAGVFSLNFSHGCDSLLRFRLLELVYITSKKKQKKNSKMLENIKHAHIKVFLWLRTCDL